jgi:hypothetical protein
MRNARVLSFSLPDKSATHRFIAVLDLVMAAYELPAAHIIVSLWASAKRLNECRALHRVIRVIGRLGGKCVPNA